LHSAHIRICIGRTQRISIDATRRFFNKNYLHELPTRRIQKARVAPRVSLSY
jgi:hypothetical protein